MTIEDAADLFAYRSFPEVYVYQSWFPEHLSDAEAFIRKYSTDVLIQDQWKQFGIYLQDGFKLIGDCGFCFQSDHLTEIGYTIAPPYQHKGIGTEVVSALVGWIFNTTSSHEIIAKTDPQNTASAALLKKLGFVQIAYLEKNCFIRGKWMDDLVYSISWNVWKNQSGSLSQK